MYDRILVPLDGSKLAEAALPYAEELAAALDSQLILLGVCRFEESQFSHMYRLYIERTANLARERIEKRYGERGKTRVQSVIVTGKAAEKIITYSEENDVSLVVGTTHTRSGPVGWAIGSIAARLLQQMKRPIMLIRPEPVQPESTTCNLPSKILVPLDGSVAGEVLLRWLEEAAAKLEAEVILLQVVAPGQRVYTIGGLNYFTYPKEQLDSLKGRAKEYLEQASAPLIQSGCKVRLEVRVGDTAQEIINTADEIGASLVAISAYGRSAVKGPGFGSVTAKILQAGHTPILVFRTTP